MLDGDTCCSPQCKCRFICDKDQSRDSHFSRQAQYLVTLEVSPVAPRNVNDVSYVAMINHESHFSWQAHYLVTLEGESCCSAQCK